LHRLVLVTQKLESITGRGTRTIGRVSVAAIDLHHLGADRVIGVYALETPEGPALFDCGPATCFDALERQVDLGSIRHLLLSHIHLDHAGAAGHVVRANPQIRVHVSEIGAPHLVDPTRLIGSARRLYGDTLETLYGEPLPVPAANVEPTGATVAGLECFPTPGHASHHVCYVGDDDTLYAGDATGVRILPGRHVLPHAPPPDVDLEDWDRTFDEILRRDPVRLALIHFGVVVGRHEVARHVERTRNYLGVWSKRVHDGMTQDEFVSAARADLAASEDDGAPYYERAAPFEQSFLGLERYWRKKRERDAQAAASA
jgi:glyoxylase-like metal-dependent hydrolase (beta-lactamase superfamily II)